MGEKGHIKSEITSSNKKKYSFNRPFHAFVCLKIDI